MLKRTFMTAMSIEYVQHQYWENTIIINTVRLLPVDINMSIQEKEIPYEVGYKTSIGFILKGLSWVCTAITRLKLNATEPKV
jgi:NTE family protein